MKSFARGTPYDTAEPSFCPAIALSSSGMDEILDSSFLCPNSSLPLPA